MLESAIFVLVVVGMILVLTLAATGTWLLLMLSKVSVWWGVISLLGGIYVVSVVLRRGDGIGDLAALSAAAGVIVGSFFSISDQT